MKVVVYGSEPEDPKVRLKLEQRGEAVVLIAVNSNGERICSGSLITIQPDGVYMHYSISAAVGLPLDSDGKLRLA